MEAGNLLLFVISYFGLFTSVLFFLAFFKNKKSLINPKPKKWLSVTVVVPAYNEEKTIAATLKSLLKLDYPKDKLHIIMVDDGSNDRTYEIARRFEQKSLEVFTKKNSGKADSLNFALGHAKGELFGALDADSFVDPDCLKKMVGYFNDRAVMAVTPSLKIYRPKGILQNIQYIEYLIGIYLRKVFSYFGSIHVTPGPFTIFRKEFFEKHGGYDIHNLTEDIEVALRVQSKGYKIENTIDASVRTVAPNTFFSLLNQRKRWYIGFLNNVINYHGLFGSKHGNLGLFILPGAFISILFVITLFFYVIIKTADKLYNFALNLIASNFDILPWLNLKLDLFFLDLGPLAILAIASLTMGLIVIYLARKHSNEKAPIKFAYLLYLFAYWMLFAFWWVISICFKAGRGEVSWGKKTFLK